MESIKKYIRYMQDKYGENKERIMTSDGKIHDVTLEYADSAHIFPYSVGDEIISVPYTSFPQVK